MKHLKFDSPPAPTAEVACEGIVEDFLKKIGGWFKGPPTKDTLDLKRIPKYVRDLHKLKDLVIAQYGSLGAAQKFKLKEGLTVSPHSIACYLGAGGNGYVSPYDVPKLIHDDVQTLESWWPRLSTAARHYLHDTKGMILKAERNMSSADVYDDLVSELENYSRRFTMPPPPETPHFLNLAYPRFLRGSFCPVGMSVMALDFGLTKEARLLNLGQALPVLTHEQIVNYAHGMVEILNFLIQEIEFEFLPRPPTEGDVADLADYAHETGNYEQDIIWDIVDMFPRSVSFGPASVWTTYIKFMGDLVLALDRWITRSVYHTHEQQADNPTA